MNGSIFMYGTATPPAQRAEQEAHVNKIIKANLPQELSRYFLFDAMEAGNLLKEDQLNRVIKENIENVMGFNKYLQLAKAAEGVFQQYTAQRLEVENEKQEYLHLIEQKKTLDEQLARVQQKSQDALQYSVAQKELYDNLKSGLSEETTIQRKLEQTKNQVASIHQKETLYRDGLEGFVKEIELNVCLPKLAEAIRSEVNLILKSRQAQEQSGNLALQPEQVETISRRVLDYLQTHDLVRETVALDEIIAHVLDASDSETVADPYGFLDFAEVKALENLLNTRPANPFPTLNQQQIELDLALEQIPTLENQIEMMKAQITGKDYSLLKAYEENEGNIQKLDAQSAGLRSEIEKIEKKLHQFDIQLNQEPDPRYEALGKLKGYFENVADTLLKSKKQSIEHRMKADLNVNLAAYQDVIERVELSENLANLTFKIYHKAGNEIYLNQLNTASKQVVVQVLLKALHEFGDYEPPVMIDTVMGVLDETSRSTVLENYFPNLAQQIILLSSDSEIRPTSDLERIEAHVSKAYTLERDIENQCTQVEPGYFGIAVP